MTRYRLPLRLSSSRQRRAPLGNGAGVLARAAGFLTSVVLGRRLAIRDRPRAGGHRSQGISPPVAVKLHRK